MMPAKFSTERSRAATRSPSSADTSEANRIASAASPAWRRVIVMTSGAAASTTRPWSSPTAVAEIARPARTTAGPAGLASMRRSMPNSRSYTVDTAVSDEPKRQAMTITPAKTNCAVGAAGAGIRDGVVAARHQQQPDEGACEAADEPAGLARRTPQVTLHDARGWR